MHFQKGKKGIYFTLEAIIALLVMSVGFGIILYLFLVLSKPPISAVQTELYDTIELFNLPLQSIGNGTCSASSDLLLDGNITDTSNTFFNQLGEFYYRYTERGCEYCSELLSQCITDFIDYLNIEEQNIKINIEGSTWYENGTIDEENATVLFPFNILLLGVYNNSAMWGPYTGEVQVWR